MILFFKKIDDFFGRIESVLILLIFLTMLSLASLQIVLRAFHSGIVWVDPFLRSLILWLAFIGGAKTIQKSNFIKIDLAEKLFPKKWTVFIHRSLALVACGLCAYLLWIAFFFIRQEITFGDVAFLKIKTWHIELAFPLGFFLMMFHFFYKTLDPKSE
jgi:TRAP-type C4-dicarboxylate transport system permease small subunit